MERGTSRLKSSVSRYAPRYEQHFTPFPDLCLVGGRCNQWRKPHLVRADLPSSLSSTPSATFTGRMASVVSIVVSLPGSRSVYGKQFAWFRLRTMSRSGMSPLYLPSYCIFFTHASSYTGSRIRGSRHDLHENYMMATCHPLIATHIGRLYDCLQPMMIDDFSMVYEYYLRLSLGITTTPDKRQQR